MLNIRCTIENSQRANDHYNWDILGQLIIECIKGSVRLGAELDNGFEIRDWTISPTQPVRTFSARFTMQDGEAVTTHFAFRNEPDLSYLDAVVMHPTTLEDGLLAHARQFPLE